MTAGAAQAQNKFYGIANRWSIAAGVGTEGVGFEAATNLGKSLALRAVLNVMPGISYDTDVDIDVKSSMAETIGFPMRANMNVEGTIDRTSVGLMLDYYPGGGKFFVTGGFSFAGNKVIKVKGHSQDIADAWQQYGSLADAAGIKTSDVGIQIDDYFVPIDRNGDISGGLKVGGFRPYLGLGFGRAVPKNRVGCRLELGVQFHGSPEFYVDNGDFTQLKNAAASDDDVSEVIDFIEGVKVYPVLKFTLRGRIL